MRKIDYKKIIKNDKFAVYFVYIDNKCIGKIYIVNKKDSSVVKYNFDEKKFNYLIGSILMNNILHWALDNYNNVQESKIYFKDSCHIDYYPESFEIKKHEENNKVCYCLKR